MSFSARQPDNLGVHDGHLAVCPSSPNAVSSEATDSQHKMEPIPLAGSATEAISRLQQVISKFSNAKMVTSTPDYLHAEFTSTFFRFVDDVEFYANESEQLIHFRSASRVGHSDFGANRKRMEKITAAYARTVK
ncbi:MAG: DUF1499 domain-containing protein [Planctomycetes bacterium]|nr:DUF1499 domain-containing protein [Planctomycetota bacterium]